MEPSAYLDKNYGLTNCAATSTVARAAGEAGARFRGLDADKTRGAVLADLPFSFTALDVGGHSAVVGSCNLQYQHTRELIQAPAGWNINTEGS